MRGTQALPRSRRAIAGLTVAAALAAPVGAVAQTSPAKAKALRGEAL